MNQIHSPLRELSARASVQQNVIHAADDIIRRPFEVLSPNSQFRGSPRSRTSTPLLRARWRSLSSQPSDHRREGPGRQSAHEKVRPTPGAVNERLINFSLEEQNCPLVTPSQVFFSGVPQIPIRLVLAPGSTTCVLLSNPPPTSNRHSQSRRRVYLHPTWPPTQQSNRHHGPLSASPGQHH